MTIEVIYLPEVRKFINKLDFNLEEQVVSLIYALADHGHLLRMPYSKALGRGLFELRILGQIQIRIFYCFYEDKVYLLYAIIKKRRTLAKADIARARELKRLVERL
ncbi:MAG: type II toxin-antitoxin system RelE/ParE family toxin [Candidatus Zambryskibacteria bacterium]|nr:type II toxin-antitoxin system RelE/ParE family toxin [Candidatus Zambryskibacteria bacterium]